MNDAKHMIYINYYDDWYLDLIFIKDTKYLEKEIPDLIIALFYNAANHRLFVSHTSNKTPQQSLQAFISFQQYIQGFPDQFIDKIITDQGNEWKSIFEQTLLQNNIQHQVIIRNVNDHKSLAHINGMAAYVRKNITKLIDAQEIINVQRALDEFMSQHNFKRKIPLYKQTPNNISREDVNNMNEQKEQYNKKYIDKSNEYQIGDYVQIINKREDKEKKRLQKWSEQVFQIFDKQGQTFMLTPLNFSMSKYKDVLGVTKNNTERYSDDLPFSNPVYRRKYYELRQAKPNDKYLPFEQEDTRLYQFNKINDCVIDVQRVFRSIENMQQLDEYINKNNRHIYYEIENNYGKFFVPISMIRYQNQDLTLAEQEFWLNSKNKKYALTKDQYKIFKYILYI
ncbi:Conserved_hypothetical protein [Hexamita inflata]|uniref:Integrase catalytic domain-containing protein n=1 Tax=Hexamita inflata TaxID=28002 RepID=A0AA86NW97_9EUKA|nr:Conserved hypothetical protein [Hexamita inflata]